MHDSTDLVDMFGTDTTSRTPPARIDGTSLTKETVTGKLVTGTTTALRWALANDVFWPASETCNNLKPAFYNLEIHQDIGPCVKKIDIQVDSLLRLPDSASDVVMREFAEFWTLRPRFIERGFLHKRGILLFGPPGSGKTATLMLMAQDVISQGGIVCQIGSLAIASICLSMIRKIEPSRPIIALLEDIDSLIEQYGEHNFLSLLDGESQVDNICFVATTNYPEKLDKRFVDRPSRFDTIRRIGMPTAAARRAFLAAKEPSLQEDDLIEWVRQTEGFSIAHLRELIILVKCFDRPLCAAIERLESMRTTKPKSTDDPDRPMFGFGVNKR